ncbi:MAG: hypothetical protein R3B90_13330 [Planctomycetaceae bacterium]
MRAREIEVRRLDGVAVIEDGVVDVGKHLRPNLRSGRAVLFVASANRGDDEWVAVKLK